MYIREWMNDPDNIAVVYRQLRQRVCAYDPFGMPPNTDAKRAMLAASQSGIDEAWRLFVEQADGDICTAVQWRTFAHRAKSQYDLEYPEPHVLDRILDNVLQGRAQRVMADKPLWQIKVKNALCRPWIIRNADKWAQKMSTKSNTDIESIRVELLRNGEPGGSVVQLPKRK
jgi:hypothetical protein